MLANRGVFDSAPSRRANHRRELFRLGLARGLGLLDGLLAPRIGQAARSGLGGAIGTGLALIEPWRGLR